MPSIPVVTPLGYLGVFFLITGFFLVIAGLGILQIEKVTVRPGKITWLMGLIIAIVGLLFLAPDIVHTFPPSDPIQATQTAEAKQTEYATFATMTQLANITSPTSTVTPPSIPSSAPTSTLTPTLTATPTLGVGSTWIRPADGMTMMYVPAGEFVLGSNNGEDNEKPAHTVYLDAYWIDRTEVTNAMYAICVQAGNCQPPFQDSSYYNNTEYAKHPVRPLNLDEAISYCKWADARIPTEAEWEKAARGTDGRIYPWGNKEPDCSLANVDSCGGGGTTIVGSYPAGISPYGALDMIGNVWEWVTDWYNETYYANSPDKNPQGPSSGQNHLVRGGSWFASGHTTSTRLMYDNSLTRIARGFRCVRSLP